MSDTAQFSIIGPGNDAAFGGYVSAVDRTAISRRLMVKGSKNVYRKKTGTIANRPGLLRRGNADSTEAGTVAADVWDTSLGFTRPLRVNNSKLQVESDILLTDTYVWYDLLTLTNTRVIFDTWWDNTAKKDILLFCDGTDSMKYWSGAIGLIDSTTVNTIVLTSTVAALGFTTSGTVIINGVEYTYSGASASTLTGVSPDPTSNANGSVVLEKPVTDADTVEADYLIDFIKVVNNQLLVGSERSRLVYLSKNTDWDDFSKSSPRATGEGDTIILDEVPYGIGARNGKSHIGTRKAWYEISFKQITVGSNLSEQTEVKKVPVALKQGLLRHEFIDNDRDGEIVYLSLDQQLRIYGDFPNYTNPKFPSISDDIENELYNEDFTGGHMTVIGDFIYLVSPNNGRVWLHETQTRVNRSGNLETEKMWHAPFIWNLSRIVAINGVEYGHSNSRPQLYQMWDTLQWHDDSPSDEPIPYDSVLVFGYRRLATDGVPGYGLIEFDQMYVEGYMTPGSLVEGAIAYEYKGERSIQLIEINTENTTPEFYTGDIGISLGDASLGDNPLGDQTSDEEADQELLPKFRHIADVELSSVHEYQPRIYSSEVDSRWELLAIGANEREAEEVPAYLRE